MRNVKNTTTQQIVVDTVNLTQRDTSAMTKVRDSAWKTELEMTASSVRIITLERIAQSSVKRQLNTHAMTPETKFVKTITIQSKIAQSFAKKLQNTHAIFRETESAKTISIQNKTAQSFAKRQPTTHVMSQGTKFAKTISIQNWNVIRFVNQYQITTLAITEQEKRFVWRERLEKNARNVRTERKRARIVRGA